MITLTGEVCSLLWRKSVITLTGEAPLEAPAIVSFFLFITLILFSIAVMEEQEDGNAQYGRRKDSTPPLRQYTPLSYTHTI